MNYTIDTNSKIPAYLQLYEQIRQDITTGAYPFGSRLPAKRTVAAETGTSVITVQHALDLLDDEGYIESRERSGSFVVYRKGDFSSGTAPTASAYAATASTASAYAAAAYTADTLSADVSLTAPFSPPQAGQTGDFPFSVLAKTMRRVISDYGESLLTRSPNDGCPELRGEITAYLMRSRGISVDPRQIVVGAGAEYLYSLIAQLLGKTGIFALEDPSYGKIREVYTALGITCDLLPLSPGGIPSDELKRTGARVLHCTPFNSYPSGITVDISKKHEYLSWAADREGFIVEDNYDSELTVSTKAEDSLFAMSGGHRVIYVNTFSRTIAPSIRVGYMILPAELMEEFSEKLGFYACTVPLFEQYVLARLLRSGDFERNIARIRRKRRRELVAQEVRRAEKGTE